MNSYSNKIFQEGQLKESCPSSQFEVDTEIISCPTSNQIIPKILLPIPISSNDNHQEPYFTVTKETLSKVVVLHEQNSTTTRSDSLQKSPPNGIDEILAALKTNIQTGISGDEKDLYLRHQAFGSNHNYDHQDNPPLSEPKCLKKFLLDAFKDTNVLLLLCCAMLSLLIGIKRNGLQEGFLDGAIIFLAIFMVVNFGAMVKFYKSRKNIMKKKVVFGVIRRGKVHHIPVSEIVVGDIVILKTGDQIPADGLYVDGSNTFKLKDGSIHEGSDFSKNPSIFSGGKVVKGECWMLVTSVGENTEKRKLMRSISNHQSGESKLQIGIDKMNNKIEKIWLFMSLLVLVVGVLRCFVFNSGCDEDHDPDPKGVKNTVEEIMNEAAKVMKKKGVRANGLVAMLCVLIFSIRDGLPLGILVLLAFGSRKMKSHKATVLNLPACATTGLVTTICTCKTGDLVLQPMKMADLWIGLDRTNELFNHEVAPELLNRLNEAVFVSACDPPDEVLLWWAKKGGLVSITEVLEQNFTILPSEGFDVNKDWKYVKRNGDGGNVVHVYWKGEPEVVLSMCSHYYHTDGTMQTLDEQKRSALMQEIIHSISSHSFAFAYKQVVIGEDEEGKETLKPIKSGLTWLGLVDFKNPYEPRLKEAIEACAKLGKKIKLVVGDDIITARLMGIYSGILKPEEEEIKGAVVEALEFRNSSHEDRLSMIDNVRVMANATPYDRLLMVQYLRQEGEVVLVTGTCTRDSPSLKEADVGIFSCDDGAQETKEIGDIVVSGSNFEAVLCDMLKLGRCICNNLEKFIQLQLTLNIVAFTLNFLVAVSTREVPLSPFQVLWVNLIMDVFGALALAAQVAEPPPSESHQPPVYGEGPVITKAMWRNIGVQSFYPVIVLLIVDLKGGDIFQVNETIIKVMVFNCYVLCQVFVLINAREIEKANVFEGILDHKNYWFIVIVGAIVVMQEVMIEIAAAVAHTGRLDLKEWCICIGIAGVTLPIDWVAKWVFIKLFVQN